MTAQLLHDCAAALTAVDEYVARARAALIARFGEGGPNGEKSVSARVIDANQFTIHGFAWVATYAESLRQLHGWPPDCRPLMTRMRCCLRSGLVSI